MWNGYSYQIRIENRIGIVHYINYSASYFCFISIDPFRFGYFIRFFRCEYSILKVVKKLLFIPSSNMTIWNGLGQIRRTQIIICSIHWAAVVKQWHQFQSFPFLQISRMLKAIKWFNIEQSPLNFCIKRKKTNFPAERRLLKYNFFSLFHSLFSEWQKSF